MCKDSIKELIYHRFFQYIATWFCTYSYKDGVSLRVMQWRDLECLRKFCTCTQSSLASSGTLKKLCVIFQFAQLCSLGNKRDILGIKNTRRTPYAAVVYFANCWACYGCLSEGERVVRMSVPFWSQEHWERVLWRAFSSATTPHVATAPCIIIRPPHSILGSTLFTNLMFYISIAMLILVFLLSIINEKH